MKIILRKIVKKYFPHLYVMNYKKNMKPRLQKNKRLKNLASEQYPSLLAEHFKEKLGMTLNLDNPLRWTEKMQWLKIYDATRQKADWTDKLKAKNFARDVIGEEHIILALMGG